MAIFDELKTIFDRLMFRRNHHKFCKLNSYYCPDCIYHEHIFDKGGIYRGNRCHYGERTKDEYIW